MLAQGIIVSHQPLNPLHPDQEPMAGVHKAQTCTGPLPEYGEGKNADAYSLAGVLETELMWVLPPGTLSFSTNLEKEWG